MDAIKKADWSFIVKRIINLPKNLLEKAEKSGFKVDIIGWMEKN